MADVIGATDDGPNGQMVVCLGGNGTAERRWIPGEVGDQFQAVVAGGATTQGEEVRQQRHLPAATQVQHAGAKAVQQLQELPLALRGRQPAEAGTSQPLVADTTVETAIVAGARQND